MKVAFRRSFWAIMILSLSVLSLSSCKKDNDGDTPSDRFPLSNLTLTITSNVIYPNSNSVMVGYDVKNVSGANYTIQRYQLNPVKVKVTIGTTDGTTYQSSNFISDVEAGRSVAMEHAVSYGSGKTADLTKTKVELVY